MTVTTDPNAALSGYIQAWQNEQTQYKNDVASLYGAINTMLEMLNSGNVEEAFQYAGMVVMTQSMSCIGDNTGQFAGAENIATGIRNVMGSLQSIFNEGHGINQTDANNFAQWINEFYNNTLDHGSQCPTWMDSSDYANMVNSIKSIYSEFGVSSSNPTTKLFLNGTQVMNHMQQFFPTTQKTAPNQAITLLQGDFQTLNNSVSALSSSATASEQYWTNVYNQDQGVTNNIFQSIGQLNGNSVNNEKTN